MNGCDLTVVNCLIADYYAGIALNNSACSVRATTIDSCRGPSSPDDLPADWPADWPVDFAGGGIIASRGESYSGNTDIYVEESIITNCESGIDVSGPIAVEVEYSNFWNNDIHFYGDQATFIQSHNLFQDPRFVTGRDHAYYLSAIGAGQSINSPCIDAGNPSKPVYRIINGSTRTDGLHDICAPDIGYHGQMSALIVGIGNINNDNYELEDPRTTLARADKTTEKDKKQTSIDVSSIFSTGPKDVVVLKENVDGIFEFQTYFQDGCNLQQQDNLDSPTHLIDASLSDVNGDGVPDLVVLEESGPKCFINDTSGALTLDSGKTILQSKAIAVEDVNRDGYKDMLVATTGGVTVQMADTHLSWSQSQLIPSGNTENLLLHDFNNDGYSDLVTVDSDGVVRFYKNRRTMGFAAVGDPVQIHGYGNMMVQDADNDGQMDVVVEIASGVNEAVAVGSIFGIQPIQPGGKRGIRYVLFDHLGSAKMLINDQCDVVWPGYGIMDVNKLLPFGQERSVQLNSSEVSYNLNFTNKELDRDLELNYFGARYYHPELPRFISPDPVSGKPAIPLSWNRYLYCRNDPINLYDPDGNNAVANFIDEAKQKTIDKGVAMVKTCVKVLVIAEVAKQKASELPENRRWPYAHIYASARIKQEHGLAVAVVAGLAKEKLDLAKGVMGNVDSLKSADQLQDYKMNFEGIKISDGEDPHQYALDYVKENDITEGSPGPWYLLLQPFLTTSEMAEPEQGEDQ